VPKEKVCDESPIELQVESVSEWSLQRPPVAADLLAPLPPANPLLRAHRANVSTPPYPIFNCLNCLTLLPLESDISDKLYRVYFRLDTKMTILKKWI
jgi:hypothetical protein